MSTTVRRRSAAFESVVNLFLLVINLVTSPRYLWFFWVLLGWGIGVVAHAVSVIRGGVFGSDWAERKAQELLEKERGRGR
jgi:hypothetical protein